MKHPNYTIDGMDEEVVLLRDLGPWDKHPSITNAAEAVVLEMVPVLKGRRLEYIDSDGRRDQLLVKDGKFAGFAPCQKSEV